MLFMCTPDVHGGPLLLELLSLMDEGVSHPLQRFCLFTVGTLVSWPFSKFGLLHTPFLFPYKILPNMKSSHSFGFHNNNKKSITPSIYTVFTKYGRGNLGKGSCYTVPGLLPSTECSFSQHFCLFYPSISGATHKVPEP